MAGRIRFSLISLSTLLVFYIVIGGLLGKTDTANEKAYRDLGVYSEVLSRIKQDYVIEPDLKKVTDGAIRGLLESLDPYNTYLNAQEYQDYIQRPNPGPAGIGVFLSKRYSYVTVVSVLPGGPGEKAGIKVGDLIDRVENSAARDLSVLQIDRLLAGSPGSVVTLAVVRGSRGEPQKVAVTRALPRAPPVVAKMVHDHTGYLRVATFNRGKAAEIASKLKDLISNGADKIVLDLRNCAEGDVEEAVNTASLFLDTGLVAYLSGQHYPRQDFPVKPSSQVSKLPLVVLINQSTAGPAELVASAVQGNHRGDVVGVRSFGVGVYQKLIPVGDGSALLLSVAKYYGPGGNVIQDHGVTPNVVQAAGGETESMTEEDYELESPERFGEPDDLQLQKAIEILKTKSSVAKAA